MEVTLWGTRGSIASAGPETTRYGGNTSCVEVRGREDCLIIFDAGTGIRRLGAALSSRPRRLDLLLSHLHLDHLQGLGFFRPLFERGFECHIWGPVSPTLNLTSRLTRYLSPPLFPVLLRDLDCELALHDVPDEPFGIGPFRILAAPVIHPGPTLGYRVEDETGAMAYLPDHEPALGSGMLAADPAWVSGYDLAVGVDHLVHDAQYTDAQYEERVGWGHSRLSDAVAFARLAGARTLVTFHHDPDHSDEQLDEILAESSLRTAGLEVIGGHEGDTFTPSR